ncbi:MAG TPA: hypothetical protein VNF68_03705 [Candidatus Baltobacteraceae bacterium]|nr:hypothetical protein [Candidatus Baltobacteraceae bacterium]
MTLIQGVKLVSTATFVVALVSCGGSGAGVPSSPGVPPTEPTTNSQTVTLQAQGSSVPLPAVSSYTGTILMPGGSGTVTITSAMQPPTGIPAPATFAPLVYVNFSAPVGAVTMNQMPGFSMDMSGMMGSQSYYMAQYQNGMWTTAEGPAMMSGSTMMMNGGTMAISIPSGGATCFAYYMGSLLASDTPSAMPSAMPTM